MALSEETEVPHLYLPCVGIFPVSDHEICDEVHPSLVCII